MRAERGERGEKYRRGERETAKRSLRGRSKKRANARMRRVHSRMPARRRAPTRAGRQGGLGYGVIARVRKKCAAPHLPPRSLPPAPPRPSCLAHEAPRLSPSLSTSSMRPLAEYLGATSRLPSSLPPPYRARHLRKPCGAEGADALRAVACAKGSWPRVKVEHSHPGDGRGA